MSKENETVAWKRLYTVGGIAALMTVLVGLVETGIQFLPEPAP